MKIPLWTKINSTRLLRIRLLVPPPLFLSSLVRLSKRNLAIQPGCISEQNDTSGLWRGSMSRQWRLSLRQDAYLLLLEILDWEEKISLQYESPDLTCNFTALVPTGITSQVIPTSLLSIMEFWSNARPVSLELLQELPSKYILRQVVTSV